MKSTLEERACHGLSRENPEDLDALFAAAR